MPIRQGGKLARRFSSWQREHLAFRTMAPAFVEADQVKDILADIDADDGDLAAGVWRLCSALAWAVPLFRLSPSAGGRGTAGPSH
jgi:hypothetical protein